MIDILEFMGKPEKERQKIMDKMTPNELVELHHLLMDFVCVGIRENPMIVRDK